MRTLAWITLLVSSNALATPGVHEINTLGSVDTFTKASQQIFELGDDIRQVKILLRAAPAKNHRQKTVNVSIKRPVNEAKCFVAGTEVSSGNPTLYTVRVDIQKGTSANSGCTIQITRRSAGSAGNDTSGTETGEFRVEYR